MPRERITVTRPDATGFDVVIKPVRDRCDYTTRKVEAIEAFEKKRKASTQNDKLKIPSNDSTHTTQAESGIESKPASNIVISSEDEKNHPQAIEEVKAKVRPKPETSRKLESDAVTESLLDLTLPPRRRPDGYLNISLRLRVLDRQVNDLQNLEANGVDMNELFRAAYRTLPPIIFNPRYVPQVAEPSGPARYAYRIRPAVLQQTIKAIEAQVRGGENASRASLLLGQIEPAWFAKLDLTIKEFMK